MPGRGAPGVPGVAPTAPSNISPPAPASVSPPAPSGASRPAPAGEAAQAPKGPPEFRLYFSDYREVDGLQLPFRLRRALGSDTTEETTFDRFRINTKIDPKRFEVRK